LDGDNVLLWGCHLIGFRQRVQYEEEDTYLCVFWSPDRVQAKHRVSGIGFRHRVGGSHRNLRHLAGVLRHPEKSLYSDYSDFKSLYSGFTQYE
jgi:hypothetical protein